MSTTHTKMIPPAGMHFSQINLGGQTLTPGEDGAFAVRSEHLSGLLNGGWTVAPAPIDPKAVAEAFQAVLTLPEHAAAAASIISVLKTALAK
jgi:hypothetical protein